MTTPRRLKLILRFTVLTSLATFADQRKMQDVQFNVILRIALKVSMYVAQLRSV